MNTARFCSGTMIVALGLVLTGRPAVAANDGAIHGVVPESGTPPARRDWHLRFKCGGRHFYGHPLVHRDGGCDGRLADRQQVHLLSPLVPSTYRLVGMAGIEFGEHHRFTLLWALGSCLVMLVIAVLFGIFQLGV